MTLFLNSSCQERRITPSSVPRVCPICRAKAPLYEDSLISSALTRFSPDVLSVEVNQTGALVPCTGVPPPNVVVDLVSPPYLPHRQPPHDDQGEHFSLDTPDTIGQSSHARSGQQSNRKRRFSFGDGCWNLGRELGVGNERYRRLSTIDLSSPS